MVESGSQSTKGLIIVSKLYQEGKIDDDQRDQLKGKKNPASLHFHVSHNLEGGIVT